MKKRILAVYYSQSGQSREIVKSLLAPLEECGHVSVTWEPITPEPDFPFPWPVDQFMQVFPESVMGVPCPLRPLSVNSDESFDLVILAWQPWYLSPSLPIQSFLKLPEARNLLAGKPVVCIAGCRNMWVKGHEDILKYLKEIDAVPVGCIALRDRGPNLVSVITTLRWLILGKRSDIINILPPVGVSEKDIKSARKFGTVILSALRSGSFNRLQEKLLAFGAVEIFPSLLSMEKTGKRIFKKWAAFILKKGNYGDTARSTRLSCFKYYLLMVIFFISPIISFLSVVHGLIRPEAVRLEVERHLLMKSK